jgi:ribonuclease III
MRRADPKELEDAIGHSFGDKHLLTQALTHASAINGGVSGQTYQRLEFLGDRVLGLVVADFLVELFPEAPEGDLSRRLARLVSRETCTEVADEMRLEKFLRVGGGPRGRSPATPSVLADACEAVIGAVYRDGGLPAAQKMIGQFWLARIDSMTGPLRDAKTALQEWAQRRGMETPSYAEISRSGPDHAPEFEIEVIVGTIPPGRGIGRSKREAEQVAAAAVLRREGEWDG